MQQILNELTAIASTINEKQCKNIVDALCSGKYKKIVGFGAGRMGYSLRAFIMRLSHLGFTTYMIGDTNFPKIDNETLVIFNSSSGNTETMVLYAEQARRHGGHLITVSANEYSGLSKLSDSLLTYKVEDSTQIMKTAYEQFTFILFDYIAEMVIKEMKLDRNWVSQNHSISE